MYLISCTQNLASDTAVLVMRCGARGAGFERFSLCEDPRNGDRAGLQYGAFVFIQHIQRHIFITVWVSLDAYFQRDADCDQCVLSLFLVRRGEERRVETQIGTDGTAAGTDGAVL